MADPAAAQECTTTIGAVLPTSVDWGRPIAETGQFAVDIANEAGGVAGCKIEMILRDTQVDPKVGVDAAKSLVDLEKVPLVLGAVSSGVSMPILTSVTAPSGRHADVLLLVFDRLHPVGPRTARPTGLWFRTFATSSVQSAVGAMLAQRPGLQESRRLLQERRLGAGHGAPGFEQSEGPGRRRNRRHRHQRRAGFLPGRSDGRPQAATPTALYMALYPKEGTAITREWISLGGTRRMVVANSLKSDEFRDNVGLKYLGESGRHGHVVAARRIGERLRRGVQGPVRQGAERPPAWRTTSTPP